MAGADNDFGKDTLIPAPWRQPIDPATLDSLRHNNHPREAQPGSDARAAAPNVPLDRNRTLTLTYGDHFFDERLKDAKDILEIKNLPARVGIKSWMDDKGLYFWFENGDDNKAHHYIPDGMQAITVNQQRKDVDQMRVETYLAMQVPEAAGLKFPPLNQNTSAKAYGTAMTSLSEEMITKTGTALAKGAADYPDNPYFRLNLAELLVADAVKPVQALVASGNHLETIDLNNTISQVRLQQAQEQLALAHEAAQRSGNPFAVYQAQRSQVLLAALPAVLQALPQLELPPAGPVRVMPYQDQFHPPRR
ncbi:MAG TPA: hypothetical protein V6D22_16355 [Candidatus Obscuribacterales bacterium]